MPKYRVDFADGRSVVVDAPMGATDYDIDQLALDQLLATPAPTPTPAPTTELSVPYGEPVSAPAPAATMPPPRAKSTEEEESILLDTAKDVGLGLGQFGVGIPLGAVGLGELAGIGLAALLPEEQELAARDYIKRQAESAREAITPEFYDPTSTAGVIGEAVGSTLPFMLLGGIGGLAGRAAATRLGASELAGAVGGTTAGGAALGSPAGAGTALERARAEGVPEDEMTGIALAGTGVGLLESMLPLAMGRIGDLVTNPKIRAAIDKLSTEEIEQLAGNITTIGANAAKAGAVESVQEGISAALQNAIATSYDPEQDIIDTSILEEAALGGAAGAIISLGRDVLVRGRGRGRAELEPKDFTEVWSSSPLYDPEFGFGIMTPEHEAKLKEIDPRRFEGAKEGQKLTAEQVYALEKARPEGPQVRELPDEPLSEAEQEDVLKQLADAGIDVDAGEPITPAASTPPEAATTEEVVGPTDEEVEAQLRAAALEEEAQAAEDTAEAEAEVEAEPAPTPAIAADTVVDEEVLTNLGIPKGAKGLRNRVMGKPVSDPEVISAFKKYAANPKAKARAKVTEVVATLEGTLGEPIAAVPEPDAEPGAGVEGAEPVAVGAGPADGGPVADVGRVGGESDLGVGPEGGPAVAEAPEPGPVESAGVPAAEPLDGDGAQPSALAEEAPKAEDIPIEDVPDAEVETVPTAIPEAPEVEAEAAPVVAPAPVRTTQTDAEQLTRLQQADVTTLSPIEVGLVTYAPEGGALDAKAVETIAYDAVAQETDTPNGGLSAIAAVQWIRRNGSPEANAQLDAALTSAQRRLRTKDNSARSKAVSNLTKALIDPNTNPKTLSARVKRVRELNALPKALKAPLGRQVIQALRANNVAEAIGILAETVQTDTKTTTTDRSTTTVETGTRSPYSPLAKALQPYVGAIDVEFVKGLTDADGAPIAGAYDAQTGRILLDEKNGKNPHTLLHELSHALTLQAIDAGNTPAVRRLQKIYEKELQPALGDAYAGTSLKEFVSEYLSNPETRRQAAGITSKAKVHPIRRFGNEIMNIMRRIMGRDTRDSIELPTAIDKMLFSILQPQPGSPASEVLITGTGKERDTYLDRLVKDYFKDAKNLSPEEGRKAMLSFANIFKSENNASRARAILTFANSLQLADLFRFFSPRLGELGRDLHNTLNESLGSMQKVMQQTDVKYRAMMDWRKRNPKKARGVDRVAMLTTLEQVDPTKDRSAYKDNPEKLLAYDRIEGLWAELGTDGQEQWKLLRKHYQDMFTQLKDVLFTNIDRYVEDAETGKRLKNEVFRELFEKSELEVYFPLARQGDYWLTYDWGGERVVEAFATKAERNAAMKDLREEGGKNIRAHGAPTSANITNNVPSESFVGRTLDILNKSGVSQQAKDQVIQLFVDALPETSLIRALQKRKNRLGAIEDTSVAFRQKGYSLAREISRIKYANELRSVQDAIATELESRQKLLTKAQEEFAEANVVAEKEPNQRNIVARNRARKRLEERIRRYGAAKMSDPAKNALNDEVKRRVNFVINPPKGFAVKTSKLLNQITFFMTMGFNPASAMVQTAQIPVVNYWDTASRTNEAVASKAYTVGMKFFGGAGLTVRSPVYDSEGRQVGVEEKIGANPSIDNYYVANADGTLRIRDDIPTSEKETFFDFPMPGGGSKKMTRREFLEYMLPLVQLAQDRGQLGNSLIMEQLEINNALNVQGAGRVERMLDRLTALGGLLFHNSEMFNRQVTLVANYINEMHRLNTKPTAEERGMSAEEQQRYAANEAIYRTEQTNGGSTLVTAPNIAQGGQGFRAFGRLVMMYRTYGFAMYYHQFKSLMQSPLLNSIEDPETKKAALKALVKTQIAAGLAAGVQGMTLTGIIMGAWKAANAALDLFDDEPKTEEEIKPEDLRAEEFFEDLLWNGLPQYASNQFGGELDIASRIGLSNLIISNSRYLERAKSVPEYVASALFGASGSTIEKITAGVRMLSEGERERALELMMPTFAANFMRNQRYAEEGDRTRSGSYIINEYTDTELAGKAIGFGPMRRVRQQQYLSAVKAEEEKAKSRGTALRKALNVAILTGDDEARREAYRRIGKFNDTYGRQYPSQFIDDEKLQQSWDQFIRGKEDQVGGVQFMIDEFRFMAEDYVDMLESLIED